MRALLALEDGSLFWGESIGAPGKATGEVVFNTAMTGYQEILTDPSYCRQIITLTYPHIGNVGVNPEDAECDRIFAAGLVIRDTPTAPSNWRAERDLTAYLHDTGVVAIAGIDTRRLTRRLREHGAQDGCLWAGDDISPEPAIAAARAFPGLAGSDLARVVSTREQYAWEQGVWTGTQGFSAAPERRWRVVAFDFGIKRNILRMLAARGCHISVVPATTAATEVLAMQPDGVFLSNGPGDPEPCDYAVDAVRALIGEAIPIFGICLGYQLLALASGARTSKMKFGHHGANHPVRSLDTGRVIISSQNHGFTVDEDTLPGTLRATHRSLFDATLQGVERNDAPAFGFQGHPEASPGPQDAAPLFEHFIALMKASVHAQA